VLDLFIAVLAATAVVGLVSLIAHLFKVLHSIAHSFRTLGKSMNGMTLDLMMKRFAELDAELKVLIQRLSSVEDQLKTQNRFEVQELETKDPRQVTLDELIGHPPSGQTRNSSH
jgi:hypothetical protein